MTYTDNKGYNTRISERANRSIIRRKAQIRREKRLLVFIIILTISVLVLLGTSIRAMAASSTDSSSYRKVYKSIVIEHGDTLWGLADEYNICSDISRQEYIREVQDLNHLTSDTLHVGQNIIIAFYEKESK